MVITTTGVPDPASAPTWFQFNTASDPWAASLLFLVSCSHPWHLLICLNFPDLPLCILEWPEFGLILLIQPFLINSGSFFNSSLFPYTRPQMLAGMNEPGWMPPFANWLLDVGPNIKRLKIPVTIWSTFWKQALFLSLEDYNNTETKYTEYDISKIM